MIRLTGSPALVMVFLLCACSKPVHPAATLKPEIPITTATPTAQLPFLSQTSLPGSIGSLLPGPTIPADRNPTVLASIGTLRTSYALQAVLDYAGHRLTVDEKVRYMNNTGVSLPDLVLAVEPNLWEECFRLDSLSVNGLVQESYILEGGRLQVPLLEPLEPGGVADLSLNYILDLPAVDSMHVFGYNSLQVNLVDWFPFVVPYSGGWLLHPPARVGEHLVYDKADFHVILTLADEADEICIAASAPAEMIPGGWQYSLQDARTFVFSASPQYRVISSVTDGVELNSYYFTDEELPARTVLAEMEKALKTYSSLFGPYPYPSLSAVESLFFDGMEYDGLFLLSRDYYQKNDGTILNTLVDITVHETAHQWWFGMVGNDQALEPWLDEALSTYSEELFYEENYPGVNAWWNFRVEAYAPGGWVDADIYQASDSRAYVNAVYLRGAQFLEALRSRIGDGAFFTFLQNYASKMSGKRATTADFFSILEMHTTENFSDIRTAFFQNWEQDP